MKIETLILILTKLATIENPSVEDGTEKNAAYLAGLRTMAQLYVEVGSEGRVISPEVDPVLLATIGYEESRHRPAVSDGDCHLSLRGPLEVCDAVGPMQVSRATPGVLARIDDEWKGTTVKELRDPRRNVEAAYRLLRHWNDQCEGQKLDGLFGNWAAGRCIKGTIAMGTHRCHLAQAIGEALGVTMEACTKGPTKRSASLVRGLKRRLAPADASPTKKKDAK
jgi:hypothetical protein